MAKLVDYWVFVGSGVPNIRSKNVRLSDRRTPGVLVVYAMGGTSVCRYGEYAQYADVGRAEDSKLRGQILQPVLATRGFAGEGTEIAEEV